MGAPACIGEQHGEHDRRGNLQDVAVKRRHADNHKVHFGFVKAVGQQVLAPLVQFLEPIIQGFPVRTAGKRCVEESLAKASDTGLSASLSGRTGGGAGPNE
jgi:hypothetical protein